MIASARARIGGSSRRWLRGAAILLAVLALLSAISQLRRGGPAQSHAVPLVVTKIALRPGEMLRAVDVEVTRDAISPAMTPGGEAPFGRAEDVAGRIAVRALRRGAVVTSANTIPLLAYYGVAARVPPGMRALTLVVPPASIFGGELTPRSRVDLLGAFAVGQERAATLLSSGIVLRVSADRGHSSGGLPRPITAAPDQTGAQGGSAVEVEVAVPEPREREVILAQAFGRVFLAVHPAAAEAPLPAPSTPLRLHRYLDLPAEPRVAVAPLPLVPAWRPGIPGNPTEKGTRAHAGDASASGKGGAGAPPWTVEVIGGSDRVFVTVPRTGEAIHTDGIQTDGTPQAPPRRDR